MNGYSSGAPQTCGAPVYVCLRKTQAPAGKEMAFPQWIMAGRPMPWKRASASFMNSSEGASTLGSL